MTKAWGILSVLGLSLIAEFSASQVVFAQQLDRVQASQSLRRAKLYLLNNLQHPDVPSGVVIASPSKQSPDYFYHWVRDAGLVMDVAAQWHHRIILASAAATSGGPLVDREVLEEIIKNFVRFSRNNQLAQTLSGMGEPKFYVDGRSYDGPWGRPQNDGPALRALALIRFARTLLEEKRKDFVVDWIYRPEMPARTVAKADLEFISLHWRDSSFDYWEEVRGQHFSTLMVQRRALFEGSLLAKELGDPKAAQWYREQAQQISQELENFWDAGRGYIQATRNRDGGLDYKLSELDSAVILGVLHGEIKGWSFSSADPRVLATAEALEDSFRQLYPINHAASGVAIGRYPEDRYTGYDSHGLGNPWFLTTHGLAEFYYRLAKTYPRKSAEALRLHQKGDSFILKSLTHAHADASMSEQIHLSHGFMQGAPHLTWSYASLISALWEKENL